MARAHTVSVLDRLRDDIQTGKYCQVEFLPSERQLAELYNTGRGVIRTVLRRLREENLIYLLPDRGAKIAEIEKKLSLERFFLRLDGNIALKGGEGMAILTGICAGAAENNAEVIISFSDKTRFMNELATRYAKGDVQGLILLEGWDRPNMFSALETAGVPYLIANQEQNDSVLCCQMNFRNIGRQAGRYLTGKGHRHIGVVTGPLNKFIYQEMLAGFRGALAEDEIILAKNDIIEPDEKEQYPALKPALSAAKRPTAFFAMRDHRAMKLYDACRYLGVRIPDDISVISYDNITWRDAEHAGLTTLEQPVEEIGRQSVELLKEWIVSGKKPESRQLYARLIERGSVSNI